LRFRNIHKFSILTIILTGPLVHPKVLLAFLLLGVTASYALAPPLATLLQKRKAEEERAKVASPPQASKKEESKVSPQKKEAVANKEEEVKAKKEEKGKAKREEKEGEELAVSESRQQFSVVALDDLETAATGRRGAVAKLLYTLLYILLDN